MKFLCLCFTIDSGAHYGAARGAALPGPIHFISATSVYELTAFIARALHLLLYPY